MERKAELTLSVEPLDVVELAEAELPEVEVEADESESEPAVVEELDEEDARHLVARLRFIEPEWWCLRCAPGDRRDRPAAPWWLPASTRYAEAVASSVNAETKELQCMMMLPNGGERREKREYCFINRRDCAFRHSHRKDAAERKKVESFRSRMVQLAMY